MNILHLFQSYLPYSEQWAFNLLKSLPEARHHIAARYYLRHDFYDPNFQFCPAPVDGLMIKAVTRLSGLEMGTVTHYAQTQGVDLLHAHFAPTAWQFREVIQRTALPLVVSFYGYDYQYQLQRDAAYRRRYEWIFKTATLVSAEGPHGAQKLRELGCPPEKIRVIPLAGRVGTAPEASHPKEERPVRRLLQLASFTPKKGHIDTVKAFHRALPQCPGLTLTLAGDERTPGTKAEVVQYIQDEGLSDHITLLDWVDYRQLPAFLGKYDLFIHPSRHSPEGDCEGGAPTVLLEAMAAGLPIVSTRHCDIPFLLRGYPQARLVGEGDVAGLAGAIIAFYRGQVLDGPTLAPMHKAEGILSLGGGYGELLKPETNRISGTETK